MSSSNLLKMSLFFLCFAVLLVHHHTLIAASALPGARAAALTQPGGTDPTQTKTSSMFPPKLGNSDQHGPAAPFPRREDESNDSEELQPCEVSNKTYRHRERIPRADPCEMCVCVDSEMYCFWKMCSFFNLTTAPPSPLPITTTKPHETSQQSTKDNNETSKSTNGTGSRANEFETTDEKFSKILKDQRKLNALKKLEATSPRTSVSGSVKNPNAPTSTEKPTVCYVMGVMYKYGEVLPRDTGTCLECACSEGGRVSCSPKDCVSQPDLDYLSHNNNLDMFDLDTF